MGSSALEKDQQTSLADYVKRLPAEQKEIYFLLAPNREAAANSPYFEVFQARKLEVLFMFDPWDEFVMEHLHEDLEINPGHLILIRLDQMRQSDAALAGKVAEQLLDNARVAAGLLDDPRTMLRRLNELLERLLETKTSKD